MILTTNRAPRVGLDRRRAGNAGLLAAEGQPATSATFGTQRTWVDSWLELAWIRRAPPHRQRGHPNKIDAAALSVGG